MAPYAVSTDLVWSLARPCWNAYDSSELMAEERGLCITRVADRAGAAWALGSAELWEGRHVLRFEIVNSHKSSGNMHIGVCDGSATSARCPAAKAVGGTCLTFHPWDGCLYEWEDWTQTSCSEELKPVPGGELDGDAMGAVVLLFIDMQARSMRVAINGGPPTDAGVRLPESVRPFVRLVHAGDAVRLAQWQMEAPPVPPPEHLPLCRTVATPAHLLAAAQQVADVIAGGLTHGTGHAEVISAEVALATVDKAVAAARGELAAARTRIALADPPYQMVEERKRIDAAIAARAAERQLVEAAVPMPVPAAVKSVVAGAVQSAVTGTTTTTGTATATD